MCTASGKFCFGVLNRILRIRKAVAFRSVNLWSAGRAEYPIEAELGSSYQHVSLRDSSSDVVVLTMVTS